MNLERWMKIYAEIERDFSFPREREIMARDLLSRIIGENFLTLDEIADLIGKEVYVVGNSPSLEEEIALIEKDYPIIAADGASVILYERDIVPAIVLTDLDGDIEKMQKIPAVFGIHAHGDNIERLHLAARFEKKFGTTQIEPLWNIYNFGGFTDGDRCAFLAAHFGVKIHLIGFDFANPRPKPHGDARIKRKKLQWARRLLQILVEDGAEIVWEKLK